jgi:ZIP family zinc transporter
MSDSQTIVLGALAGFTIFLGLPLGRVRTPRFPVGPALGALATGILLFLLWDVLSHAVEPVEQSLNRATAGEGWGRFVFLATLLATGFTAGSMSLVYYERWLKTRRRSKLIGPGAAAVAEYAERSRFAALSSGRQLALLIATGIGLHNFGEGLAIGQSAAAGELTLALALIVGFAAHNATEGFGIVGPMTEEVERPSWSFLCLLGLIGGGPTLLGTIVGQWWVSTATSVLFFAAAGGSILYVVQELFAVNRRRNQPVLTGWMVIAGLALGFGTDFVLGALGG